ncbi:hypothetical protein BJ741DRAFT_602801 [Chytriomyces cf. hyalinus JEL632]|nr:hypothetical protein BJ741DRAFT_602801 [Chytriomyces cf. hyalinus JEL632]
MTQDLLFTTQESGKSCFATIEARLLEIENRQTCIENALKTQTASFTKLEVLLSQMLPTPQLASLTTSVDDLSNQLAQTEIKLHSLMTSLLSETSKAQNKSRKFHTRFSALPRELVGQIFSWIHPRSVLKYTRLSRNVSLALRNSRHFAGLNLARFCRRPPKDCSALSNWLNEFDKLWLRWPLAYQDVYAEQYLMGKVNMAWEGFILRGKIPDSIGKIASLKSVIITQTSLNGSIPASIGRLENLIHLDLSYNNLSGPVPSEFANLTNLERLYLYDNNLTGPMPLLLGGLTKLTCLVLDNNAFDEGCIPDAFENLVELEYLDLRGTNRTGKIPEWIGQLRRLNRLDLANNQLRGCIPIEIAQLTMLESLSLESNRMGGTIPDDVNEGLAGLTDLTLDVSQFDQPIPTVFANLLESFVDGEGAV